MMLDGTLCQWCGEVIDDPEGFPTVCAGCQAEENVDKHGNKPEEYIRFNCDICRRPFKTEASRDQHRRDKHG